jgi:hypothetical protein
MGKNYKHLLFEERALLQTQLEMGWCPARRSSAKWSGICARA